MNFAETQVATSETARGTNRGLGLPHQGTRRPELWRAARGPEYRALAEMAPIRPPVSH